MRNIEERFVDALRAFEREVLTPLLRAGTNTMGLAQGVQWLRTALQNRDVLLVEREEFERLERVEKKARAVVEYHGKEWVPENLGMILQHLERELGEKP